MANALKVNDDCEMAIAVVIYRRLWMENRWPTGVHFKKRLKGQMLSFGLPKNGLRGLISQLKRGFDVPVVLNSCATVTREKI
ncbi:hypothetical protein OK016_22755 [Vibrio chagasii]|nr:hypothetical protein [Vibrio chagasii]